MVVITNVVVTTTKEIVAVITNVVVLTNVVVITSVEAGKKEVVEGTIDNNSEARIQYYRQESHGKGHTLTQATHKE